MKVSIGGHSLVNFTFIILFSTDTQKHENIVLQANK